MAREWSDLILSAEGVSDRLAQEDSQELEAESQPKRRRFFKRLRENLAKSREALSTELQATLTDTLDDESFMRLEETLIMADLGATATASVVGRLEQEALRDGLAGEALKQRLLELLSQLAVVDNSQLDLRASPAVIVVAGVNGSGKTTTIGKLAWHLNQRFGFKVVLGAADTYRAAASEQLSEWAQRAGAQLVRGGEGSDPGAVAYDAVKVGQESGADVVIIDTAGRLHTQDNLMAELEKVLRVVKKLYPEAPHETLLVVDSTTGQNGLRQAQRFNQSVPLSGLVLTKLDGTAKGGIALSISAELKLPVKLIGIGEQLEDLRPFDPQDFAAALFGE